VLGEDTVGLVMAIRILLSCLGWDFTLFEERTDIIIDVVDESPILRVLKII